MQFTSKCTKRCESANQGSKGHGGAVCDVSGGYASVEVALEVNPAIQFKVLEIDMQLNFRAPLGFLSCEKTLLLKSPNF